MTDQIADLLVRIRNIGMVGKYQLLVPASKMKEVILQILKNEGFIADFKAVKNKEHKYFDVEISKIKTPTHLKQLSKPGQRIYAKSKEIPRPLRGMGLVIISTPQGVLAGREAVKRGLGGELICEVW
jgi:small subunit ribosomal protein S8